MCIICIDKNRQLRSKWFSVKEVACNLIVEIKSGYTNDSLCLSPGVKADWNFDSLREIMLANIEERPGMVQKKIIFLR